MQYNTSRSVHKVPLQQLDDTTSASVSAGYLRELSKDSCNDQKYYASLKKVVRAKVEENFQVWTLPAQFEPTQFYPTKVELHNQQAFRTNNSSKSYTVVPVMTQIAIILWKLGYLDPASDEPATLATALPFGETTHFMLGNLQRVDFLPLKMSPLDHDIYDNPNQEKKILANKLMLRNACLLHYNMELGAVQRYCGGKWTGKHQCTNQMLLVMSHILPIDHFRELAAAMVDGVPNLLNAEIPSEEAASLLATANLPTVAKNPKLVDIAILKDERNHLLMVFSQHMACFTPKLGVIKLGILDKKNKKPRMYRHGSYILEYSINLINTLVDCNLRDPTIGYAWVLKHHAAYLLQLAATYPSCTIDSYNNDVSVVFLQLTHHPDIARENVKLHDNKMIVSIALHFRGNYGPASCEPIARAQCFLAQWMFQHAAYKDDLNEKVIDLMTLPTDSDTNDACIIRPQFINMNGTVKTPMEILYRSTKCLLTTYSAQFPGICKKTDTSSPQA